MEIAIIIFFIGAFIALGLLAVAILVFRKLLRNKQNSPKKFAESSSYAGNYTSSIHDSDDTDYAEYSAPIYLASDDDSAENNLEAAATGAVGFQTNETSETAASFASEGAGNAAETSYSESSYTDSSSSYTDSSSYDSSSYDSSSSSDSGSSSSWD